MDRRAIIGAMGSMLVLAAAPIVRAATTVRRIGSLVPFAPPTPAQLQEEIKEAYAPLRDLGWIEGQNLLVERRYAANRPELLRPLAEELVRLKVELIVTEGTGATLAAKDATNTIPIVMWSAGDPVRAGLVASLAWPGGNVTGYSIVSPELDAKRLSLLRELLPGVQRVGVLANSANPYFRALRKDFEEACQRAAIQPIFLEVAAPSELENAVAEVARQRAQALIVPVDFFDNRAKLRAPR